MSENDDHQETDEYPENKEIIKSGVRIEPDEDWVGDEEIPSVPVYG